MTAGVLMLLKSRVSLTCFRSCFLPGQAKNLAAPRYDCSDSLPSFMCCVKLNNENHLSITNPPVPCLSIAERLTGTAHTVE